MWLGRDCIWMGRDPFDLFLPPPKLLLFSFFLVPLPSAISAPSLVGCSLGLLNGIGISKIVRRMEGEWIKWDKCIKREFWSFPSSNCLFFLVHQCVLWGLEDHLTPGFQLGLYPEYLDLVQMRKEPFKPARCSDGLEEEIKVGLKTMLKSKKPDKTGKSRNTHEKSKEGYLLNEKWAGLEVDC